MNCTTIERNVRFAVKRVEKKLQTHSNKDPAKLFYLRQNFLLNVLCKCFFLVVVNKL